MNAPTTSNHWRVALFLVLISPFYLLGLRWGLPSAERGDMVLEASQKTDQLYQDIKKSRDSLYEADPYHVIYKPPAVRMDEKRFRDQLLQSLSSFLVRSRDGDEQWVFVGLSRIKVRQLKFDTGSYGYGGPYFAGVGASLVAGKLLGLITLQPDIVYYYQNPQKMGDIYFCARLFIALCSLLAMVLFLGLCRRVVPAPWDFIAALLFALAPVNIYLAHLIKPHMVALVFLLLGIRACADRKLYWAGVWLGAAVGTTIYIWIAPLFILFTHLATTEERGFWRKLFAWKPWLAMALSVAVYFLVNPLIFINPVGWFTEFHYIGTHHLPELSLRGFYYALFRTVPYGLGNGLALLAAFGFIALFIKRGWQFPVKGLLPVFLLFMAIFIYHWGDVSFNGFTSRYFSLGNVMIALMAAHGLYVLSTINRKVALAAGLLACLVRFEQGAFNIQNFVDDGSSRSMSFQAGRWINENIPKGESIGVNSNLITDSYPPFRFLSYDLYVIPEKPLLEPASAPKYFVAANSIWFTEKNEMIPPYQNFHDIYELKKEFVWQNVGFYKRRFAGANSPIWIYERKNG